MSALKKRRWFQGLSALLINAYLPSFLKGQIYQGKIKGACVPVLNCYSCPSAIGACPIGSLQNAMASLRFNLSLGQYQLGLYVLGILGAVGSLVGKIPCGWLCPFGLMQELLYKIPIRKFRIPTFLTYLKYVFLAATVFALPFFLVDEFGYGETWFCKWICPAGTLEAGLPLVALNAGIRGQIGLLFSWKVALLAFFLVWMIFSARPFCRTTCPLGAILGLFNKASLFRMVVDDERCTQCNDCQKKCPVENAVYKKPDSPDCIRCLSCVKNCQFGAASYEFLRKRSAKAKEPA